VLIPVAHFQYGFRSLSPPSAASLATLRIRRAKASHAASTLLLLFLKVVAAVLALMAGIAVYGTWEDRRRSRRQVAYCGERGYEYTTTIPAEERSDKATRGLFDEDHNPRWGPAIRGTCKGVPFTAFECAWYLLISARPHNRGIGAVRWAMDRTLPRFLMTPGRGFWTGDAEMRGHYDGAIIEFDDSPDFSRRYSVQGNDVAAVRALFTHDLREALAAHSPCYAAGCGRELIWWRTEILPPAERLDQFLLEGDRVRVLFARV
jgi:hypothetical protein